MKTKLLLSGLAVLFIGLPIGKVVDEGSVKPTGPSEKENLATIATNLQKAYQNLDVYAFDAVISAWKKNPKGKDFQVEHHASVRMGVDSLVLRVFRSGSSDKVPIAFITKEKGKDLRKIRDERGDDSCLTGTLENSWIGPSNTSHLPKTFTKRIRNGKLKGTKVVGGRECYVISHTDMDILRVDTYYVDARTFRLVEWNNEYFDDGVGEKSTETRTRQYTEREVRKRTQVTEGK